MFGLPENSSVGRVLPKSALYAKFSMNTAARERFDADVSRIAIANVIDSHHIAVGANVKTIYVVAVQLKHKAYDPKNIAMLARLINQNIIFALIYGEEVQLTAYCTRLVASEWQPAADVAITLCGLNLDAVWENIVAAIGGVDVAAGRSVAEQIVADDARAKLMQQIKCLEARCRAEKQPSRKLELFEKLQRMQAALSGEK